MELIVGLDSAAGAATRETSAIALAAVASAGGADGFHATFRLDKSGGFRESDMSGIRDATDRPVFLETLPSLTSIRPVLSLRPDAILLGPDRRGDASAVLDPTLSASGLESSLREARAAGMSVYLRVAAQLGSIRAAHRLGAAGVVFPPTSLETGGDSTNAEDAALEAFRAAMKLKLKIIVGPVDSLRSLPRARELAPGCAVLLGSALLDRAALLGLCDAIRLARERMLG